MMSFMLNIDSAQEFFRRVDEQNANTEEDRAKILYEMAEEGRVMSVTQTNRTEEEYVADLKKNFGVVDMRGAQLDQEETLDAQWCTDSDTGERVLIDRKTNQIIMRDDK